MQAMALLILVPVACLANSCLAPVRPFLPNDSQAASEYADIIRRDFQIYIKDVQEYFRCLEQERARAFEEAREVSQDYGRFLELVGD
ncbi:hypothetical protein JQT66_17170 [Sulfitobacter mediterraneus]|nr:hypothetical protein [Sulfitobacter mediterraneus]MBM1311974.1 hypothetical protein [Sulfitobacter mediterraneus]MBM1315889.1 hypothetical protein [Sulfitobacter mediterraneus]MBM1324217.1 hypothetical protein [Sulfitobacter mediterraneus]MBM1328122.1 hypothetical protein [Sulfitobacter mediterraneus]MBM1399519.1 hypothetical protein [Sulfitobacter mediterraneus]